MGYGAWKRKTTIKTVLNCNVVYFDNSELNNSRQWCTRSKTEKEKKENSFPLECDSSGDKMSSGSTFWINVFGPGKEWIFSFVSSEMYVINALRFERCWFNDWFFLDLLFFCCSFCSRNFIRAAQTNTQNITIICVTVVMMFWHFYISSYFHFTAR